MENKIPALDRRHNIYMKITVKNILNTLKFLLEQQTILKDKHYGSDYGIPYSAVQKGL